VQFQNNLLFKLGVVGNNDNTERGGHSVLRLTFTSLWQFTFLI